MEKRNGETDMTTTEPLETEEATRPAVERPEGPAATRRTGAPGRWRRILLGVVLPPLVLLGGAAGAYRFVITRPGMPERPPRPSSTLVTVTPVTPTTERVTVEAMGTVVPARETVLMPQVSGRIVWLSPEFLIGGRFRKDEEMLRLEKRDYELAVEQRLSDVARAECDVKLEEGQQIIAKAELDVTGLGVESAANRDLMLRKPHLKRVKAALEAAKASLEDARLDLERTVVLAPFNAVVTGQHVDLGTQASPQTSLVTLVGTDAYWVKVSLPVEKLAWIRVPRRPAEEGAAAQVRQAGLGVRDVRPGRVIRSLAQMETQGRLANLLVEVRDPLDLESAESSRPPLLLGAYVEVAIEGRTLENVVALPRRAVREGKQAWIMTPEDTLEIREIDVVWRDRERVLVAGGLSAGERVVLSAIPTPVNGMRLRVVGGAGRNERTEAPAGNSKIDRPADRLSKAGPAAGSDASATAPEPAAGDERVAPPIEGKRP